MAARGARSKRCRRRTIASANAPDVLRSPVRPQRRPLRSGPSPPTARDPSPPHSDNPGFAARERRPRRAPVAVRSPAAAWSRYPRRTRAGRLVLERLVDGAALIVRERLEGVGKGDELVVGRVLRGESFGVTTNPTAEWISRQIIEAFPWDSAPRYLIRDRDTAYGVVSGSGCVPWAFGTSRLHPDRRGRTHTSRD